jgi:hypothetical protein
LLASQPQFDDFEWNVDLPPKPQVWSDQHSQTTELEVVQIHFKNVKANVILTKFDDGVTHYLNIFCFTLSFIQVY